MTENGARCVVRFDARPGAGSREHYFHFLLGYLLPGLHAAVLRRRCDAVGFTSCGPLMDARIREACGLLGLRHSIEDASRGRQTWPPDTVEITARRWDARLRRGRPDRRRPVRAIRDHLASLVHGSVPHAIRDISSLLVDATSPPPAGAGPWLLLQRSREDAFYRPGGPAEIPTYGAGRRAIANLDELATSLAQAGVPVRVYEPGAADLADQIETFRHARGVLAIRGAELANLVWMSPGSRVIMLATPMQRETHMAWNLAVTMGIGFTQLPVDSSYPRVPPGLVLEAIVRGEPDAAG